MLVSIIYASSADKPFTEKIVKVLSELEIPYEMHLASAHKVPEKVLHILHEHNKQTKPVCFITVAGRSNALSGLIAGNTLFPVIACPPLETKEDLMININSSLMMPSEIPAMTIIDPGNAALAAARILSLNDKDLQNKLKKRMEKVKGEFEKK